MITRVVSRLFLALVLLGIAAPVWARSLHATVTLDPAIIAGTHLKAGTYDFIVKGNELVVRDDESGKVVAQAQGEIMQSKQKPDSDEVVMDKDHVQEVHFAGKTEYIALKG